MARGEIIRQVLVDRYLCIKNILIARECNPFISPCLFFFCFNIVRSIRNWHAVGHHLGHSL